MAISVDAQILIWGIKRKATPARQNMIQRAAAFFRMHESDRQQIFLPAQALAEFLVGYDAEQRRQSLARLSRTFLIAPLDAKAAAIAAELQTNRAAIDETKEHFGLVKQHIKADINVIACAIAAGATHLFSEDGQMRTLAQGKIIVEPLPAIQLPLISDDGDLTDI
jgi:predicted nucleic acid-binding protein